MSNIMYIQGPFLQQLGRAFCQVKTCLQALERRSAPTPEWNFDGGGHSTVNRRALWIVRVEMNRVSRHYAPKSGTANLEWKRISCGIYGATTQIILNFFLRLFFSEESSLRQPPPPDCLSTHPRYIIQSARSCTTAARTRSSQNEPLPIRGLV